MLHDQSFNNSSRLAVVTYIVIGAGGLGFDFRAELIEHGVTNFSPPLQRFSGAVLPKR